LQLGVAANLLAALCFLIVAYLIHRRGLFNPRRAP
jgi:hypothetical protein